jgi:Phage tail lysozyme
MNPLLLLVPQLIPQLAKMLGADQSGGFQDQVVKAIKERTGAEDLPNAQAAINANNDLKEQLQKDLEEIALEELKERNRASEEAGRIDLELYRMEADERERERTEDFERYQRDLQDRQQARTMQVHLAEELNPLAWVAPILALALVLMIAYLLRGIMLAREPVINKDVFNVVLGALVTAFTTVVAYYFGSSIGSAKKDEALRAGALVTNPKKGGDSAQSREGGMPAPFLPLSTEGRSGTESRSGQIGGDSRLPIPRTQTVSAPATGRYGLFRQKAPAIMRNLIRDLGLTDIQAAGILGNIGWECGGFRLLQEQHPIMGGHGGLGWCQWTASRRHDFERWLAQKNADFRDDDANYDFLLFELNGSQKASVAALRQATSVETATRGFMNTFERPAAKYAHLDNRIGLASLALQEFRRV